MKKKKNTLLAVGLLVAVIGLGIGYAISTQTLKVEGTATAKESGTSFNVKFTNAVAGTEVKDTDTTTTLASSTASVTSDKVAEVSVDLTNVGNSQTITFTVQNASQAGLSAKISKDNVKIYKKGTNETFSSEYFDITTNINNDITISSASGSNTATFTVTVTLKKAFVGSGSTTEKTETFDVVLEGIEAVQE